MGTTADKLNKILETKQAIKQAIVDKGVDVSDDTVFADYPSKITSIVTQGADPIYETYWNAITNNNTDYQYLFRDYNGTELDVSNLDTSNVTSMQYMFNSCRNLTSLDLSNWDTSKVINMNYMFDACYLIQTLDLSNLDTRNLKNMSYMFNYCRGLTSIDVSNWDTSNVTSMNNIFNHCRVLASLDVSSWDISKVTGTYDLTSAFNNCTALVDFKAPKNISAPMDVSNSTALSHDSLMSIINNLITVTSTKKLTLGETNLAKLTEEEKAIATGKGWTLA